MQHMLKVQTLLNEAVVKYAKMKFAEHGILVHVPCLFCDVPPEQVTQE